MKYGCFKRFGHMHRRVINVSMRSDELIQVEKTKNDRGWSKITLIKVVKTNVN